MDKRKVSVWGLLILSILARTSTPLITAWSSPSSGRVRFVDTNPAMVRRVEVVLPQAVEMIETAMAILDQGWEGMSQAERQQFLQIYDPGNTGEVEAAFINKVLENFQVIRDGFDQEMVIVYQTDSRNCEGMQLYFTDFSKIYICPFFNREQNRERLARDLVHEMAHKSLLVFDRAYYSATDSRYQTLTPYGHWSAGLPVLGKVLREIARADTLYHPDAYSRYAWAVATS